MRVQITLKKIYSSVNRVKSKIRNSITEKKWIEEVPSLIAPKGEYSGLNVGHIAFYTNGNAGDVLLPRSVRDVIEKSNSIRWRGIHAHRTIDEKLVHDINNMDRIIIGGGGLFLVDTNPNKLSGWQWKCSVDNLKKIETPIAVFAVGYNRFRNQKDFNPIFKEHLKLLAEKSIFIGLRNHGSIEAIKKYLPESLHYKIRFQPCPTTLTQILYPDICSKAKDNSKEEFIALNCAFDRIELRLGKNKENILNNLALAFRELSKTHMIKYYSHAISDETILPYLDRVGVVYELIKLYNVHPKEVIEQYSKAALVIGMRGHAQMIPFGCGVPIISLISHDKLRWFLEDINKPEWGVEMTDENFKEDLLKLTYETINNRVRISEEIREIQKYLLEVTNKNVDDFINN